MLGLLAVDAIVRRKPKKDPAETLAETRNLFYADCRNHLYTDYDLKNPVTRKSAIETLKRLQPEVKSSYLNSANYEYFERLFESKEEESERVSRFQSGGSPTKPQAVPTTFEQAEEHEVQKSYFKNVSNVIFGTAPTQIQRSVFMTERESLRTALR